MAAISFDAIIPAAGMGARFDSPLPKQYHRLRDTKTILEHTVETLLKCQRIQHIYIAISKADKYFELTSLVHCQKITVVKGGQTRAESVSNAIALSNADYVVVHDAVRPLLKPQLLAQLLDRVQQSKVATVLAKKCFNTLKQSDATLNNRFQTLNRDQIFQIETPQIMPRQILKQLLTNNHQYSDESSAFDAANRDYQLFLHSDNNLKITVPSDIDWVNQSLFEEVQCSGIGFDVHAYIRNQQPATIVLGGVKIAAPYPIAAHSDGDVLLHAICDAILGASANGDIGVHFSDKDSKYRDANSQQLLQQVAAMAFEKNVAITHIDATVICEQPKLQPHITMMQSIIANLVGLTMSQVNIKATTTEKLGFIGRGEGIAVMAIVQAKRLIKNKNCDTIA